jgi:dolichol-phosphate mannosyltransferase
VRRSLTRLSAWLELGRFAIVGGSGYIVNLAVFTVAVSAGAHYRVAATVAFLVAVGNNFFWHRRWTFAVRGGRRRRQGARFLTLSVAGFLVSLGVLSLLAGGLGVPEVPAQAVAIVAWTPLSFLCNRFWTFEL